MTRWRHKLLKWIWGPVRMFDVLLLVFVLGLWIYFNDDRVHELLWRAW